MEQNESDTDSQSSRASGNAVFTLNCTEDKEKKENTLYVSLKTMRDLQPRLYGGICYIYAKVQLLARNTRKPKLPGDVLDVQQSNVHQRQPDTQFDENFIFHFPSEKSSDIIVKLMSFEFDKYSRHEWKGELQIMLNEHQLTEVVSFTEELKQPKQVRRRREEALIVNAPRPQV
jgi:hypothetical protein